MNTTNLQIVIQKNFSSLQLRYSRHVLELGLFIRIWCDGCSRHCHSYVM